MKIINKQQYFFEENEKGQFTDFLWKSHNSMQDFAELCGISPTLLSLIVNGKRPITKTTLLKFKKNGFVLDFDESFYK